MLTRIRNAQTANHEFVTAPASRFKESILKVLESEGYIAGFERLPQKPQDESLLTLALTSRSKGRWQDEQQAMTRAMTAACARHRTARRPGLPALDSPGWSPQGLTPRAGAPRG